MSTRYVLEKHEVLSELIPQSTSERIERLNNSTYLIYSSSYERKKSNSNGYYYFTFGSYNFPSVFSTNDTSVSSIIKVTEPIYLLDGSDMSSDSAPNTMYRVNPPSTGTVRFYINPSRYVFASEWDESAEDDVGDIDFDVFNSLYDTKETKKGDYLNLISTENSSSYPNDGEQNGYWYVYKGSDCIDPLSISYGTSNPKAGQPITVNVSPRTNTYGGTISYQYQYSTDGGNSWSTASNTTSTSLSITIPSGSRQFRVRAVASDNMGFTSSTYVTGENLTLNTAPGAPSSLTVPPVVYAEKSFSISWSPSVDAESNLSGYQVQVSYNGGSSWSSSTNVSGTTYTTSVPRGNNTFRFRVRAYDTGGLYSAWATSSTIEVRSMRAYVGIDNKARRINKIYIGVNGKARQVIKGYIGVNGKARRFL